MQTPGGTGARDCGNVTYGGWSELSLNIYWGINLKNGDDPAPPVVKRKNRSP